MGFHAVVLVKTFPLMHQLVMYRTDIDEVKVISALQHKSKFNFELKKSQNTSRNSISNLLKEIKFLGFHAVVLMKTIPLMY